MVLGHGVAVLLAVLRRILVIGSGGAGKSTFARELGAILGIAVTHLDVLFWRSGWVEPPPAEWEVTLLGALAEPSWIMDGSFVGSLERRLEVCDAAVFLDLSRWLCLWRALRRVLRYRNTTRPDMATGCVESFDLPFLRWVWNYPAETRPQILRLLEAEPHRNKAVCLRSRAQVARFLADARTAGFAVAAERAQPAG